MPSLAHYMAQYDHEQESAANKLLHASGISMDFAGSILANVHEMGVSGRISLRMRALVLGRRMEGSHRRFSRNRCIC